LIGGISLELILQRSLPHQQKAVDAVSAVFNGVQFEPPKQCFENPSIDLADEIIKQNITNIQADLQTEYQGFTPPNGHLILDIKIETGTVTTEVNTQGKCELY